MYSRYHSEVVLHDATKLGDEKYYGFALKLAPDWEFSEEFRFLQTLYFKKSNVRTFVISMHSSCYPSSNFPALFGIRFGENVQNNRVSIAQFISNFRDVDCGRNPKAAVPSIMTWLQNDNLYIRLRFGNVCEDKNFNMRE